MLDPDLLRKDFAATAANLRRRGLNLDPEEFEQLEARRKEAQTMAETLRAERNRHARDAGAKRAAEGNAENETGGGTAGRRDSAAEFKSRLRSAEEAMNAARGEMEEYLLHLPNMLHESVPDGADESANAEVRKWGEPREFDFDPQDHAALGRNMGMDFDAAADMAGARFVVLSGDLARLHRALAQFMLDVHVRDHGYTEHYMPQLANEQAMRGAGQLPKFKDEVFVAERDGFYLIPTAEVVLANLARDRILDAGILPLRWTAHTACFRREAGAHGRDTRGMLRQHQFDKVELVQIAAPEDSYRALEEMTGHAEAILKLLDLPYRAVALCGGDIGFAAAKTYDLEVWLPGQGRHREISSCSNCESFQARRMKTRVRATGGGKPEYAHTLNGSGVAIGRALIAVMENHQRKDGSIRIPEPLVPYMGGAETIVPAKKN